MYFTGILVMIYNMIKTVRSGNLFVLRLLASFLYVLVTESRIFSYGVTAEARQSGSGKRKAQ